MNELDKLREKLDAAEIPYESICQLMPEEFRRDYPDYYTGNNQYSRNQVIYGRLSNGSWKLDGICQYGSYGANEGLIETYGKLGCDDEDNPLVLTADEVFQIILEDWRKKEVE